VLGYVHSILNIRMYMELIVLGWLEAATQYNVVEHAKVKCSETKWNGLVFINLLAPEFYI
jgi:hypothetical protein